MPEPHTHRVTDPSIKELSMAKGQRKSTREPRKAKKPAPPKPNASNPSTKGTPTISPKV